MARSDRSPDLLSSLSECYIFEKPPMYLNVKGVQSATLLGLSLKGSVSLLNASKVGTR